MFSRLPARMLVITLALLRYLWTLGRRQPSDFPKRILVAHHLLLGDTLMLTPLLAKLRERYPASEITMTVPKAIYPLYQKRPYGVRALPYDPRDIKTLWVLMKTAGYDLAIVPGDNRYSWLALALGAQWIIAFTGDRPAYKNWPVDELMPYPDTPAAWGDMVAGLIGSNTQKPYISTDWGGPDSAPFILPDTPYCVLHVGASSPLKYWESEKWAALASHITKLGMRVVWSAGPNEKHIIAAVDPAENYLSYAGQLTLAQLWHLIKQASLLVSLDTGIAHLGRVIDTPVVTLFGPGSAIICGPGEFWRNSAYRSVTIDNFPCRDQKILFRRSISWVRRCGRGTKECAGPRCMQAIDVGIVVDSITKLLTSTHALRS